MILTLLIHQYTLLCLAVIILQDAINVQNMEIIA